LKKRLVRRERKIMSISKRLSGMNPFPNFWKALQYMQKQATGMSVVMKFRGTFFL
jgi:hypothetical protein